MSKRVRPSFTFRYSPSLLLALGLLGCSPSDEDPDASSLAGGAPDGGAPAAAALDAASSSPLSTATGADAQVRAWGDASPTASAREAGPGDAAVLAEAGPSASRDAGRATTSGPEPVIPKASMPCPVFQSGVTSIMGLTVQIYAGPRSPDKKGPLVFYWHGNFGAGANAAEGVDITDLVDSLGGSATDDPEDLKALGKIPDEVRAEILAEGGLIIAPDDSTMQGEDVSVVGVWYAGDYEFADLITACAIENHNIDSRRIYATGASAGGLMAGGLAYQRSSYLAAVLSESGGVNPDIGPDQLQDPKHVPAVMTIHGDPLLDSLAGLVSFSDLSRDLDMGIVRAGGFAINCAHDGSHTVTPKQARSAGWQFIKDHPFGVSPEPYASGLPAGFPSYCEIVK
jgi:hypothetical protein